jgi:hypothetical protein
LIIYFSEKHLNCIFLKLYIYICFKVIFISTRTHQNNKLKKQKDDLSPWSFGQKPTYVLFLPCSLPCGPFPLPLIYMPDGAHAAKPPSPKESHARNYSTPLFQKKRENGQRRRRFLLCGASLPSADTDACCCRGCQPPLLHTQVRMSASSPLNSDSVIYSPSSSSWAKPLIAAAVSSSR